MENKDKCPYCGKSNTVVARQNGYARISADKACTFKTQTLYHIICRECGTVIRSFVKKPGKLVLRKNR